MGHRDLRHPLAVAPPFAGDGRARLPAEHREEVIVRG